MQQLWAICSKQSAAYNSTVPCIPPPHVSIAWCLIN